MVYLNYHVFHPLVILLVATSYNHIWNCVFTQVDCVNNNFNFDAKQFPSSKQVFNSKPISNSKPFQKQKPYSSFSKPNSQSNKKPNGNSNTKQLPRWTEQFRRFSMPSGARFFVEPTLRIPIQDNDTQAFHYTALVAMPITVFFDRLGWPEKKEMDEEAEMTKLRPPKHPMEVEEEMDDYPTKTQQNFAFSGNTAGIDYEEELEEEEEEMHNSMNSNSNSNQRLNNKRLDNFEVKRRYPRDQSDHHDHDHYHNHNHDQDQSRGQSKSRNRNRNRYMEEDDLEIDDEDFDDYNNNYHYKKRENVNFHIHKLYRRSSTSWKSSSFVLPHNGGERAELIPALEKIINSLGYKGSACLLRAACEIHEYPLERGYGLIGEFITIFFSVSRSKYAESHLSKYLQAEIDGKNQNCSSYTKYCETSIFQWHS